MAGCPNLHHIAQEKPIDCINDRTFLAALQSALLLELKVHGLLDEMQYRNAEQHAQKIDRKSGERR